MKLQVGQKFKELGRSELGCMISDRKQYESILQGFVGRACHCAIACNSIKFKS
ncbi:hypothetical protein ACF3DV_30605 [Chlorogloeopsis fritschii PCC 9212]|uniref:hypothetical protein n=1 Tax=Chlorogloeopsis fritschii TaxID=1124 RepID=UPI000315C036|nr:hypothetical protein [Chlorogloeopsis fritschii]